MIYDKDQYFARSNCVSPIITEKTLIKLTMVVPVSLKNVDRKELTIMETQKPNINPISAFLNPCSA
jgi:hypothetical protein